MILSLTQPNLNIKSKLSWTTCKYAHWVIKRVFFLHDWLKTLEKVVSTITQFLCSTLMKCCNDPVHISSLISWCWVQSLARALSSPPAALLLPSQFFITCTTRLKYEMGEKLCKLRKLKIKFVQRPPGTIFLMNQSHHRKHGNRNKNKTEGEKSRQNKKPNLYDVLKKNEYELNKSKKC